MGDPLPALRLTLLTVSIGVIALVAMTADSTRAARIPFDHSVRPIVRNVEFALPESLEEPTVTVVVTDSQQQPIEGAFMILQNSECGCNRIEIETDSSGSATVPMPPDRLPATFDLGVVAEGYVSVWWSEDGWVYNPDNRDSISLQLGGGAFEESTTLLRSGSLSGRVTTTEGIPIPFRPIDIVSGPECFECGLTQSADGYYSLLRLPPGEYVLRSTYDAGLPVLWTEDGGDPYVGETIVLNEGDALENLDFMIPSGAILLGVVRNVTGELLPEGRVDLVSQCTEVCPSARMGFETPQYFIEWYEGSYLLKASAPGYQTEYWTADGGTTSEADAETVFMQDGEIISGIDFSLSPIPGVLFTGDSDCNTTLTARDSQALLRFLLGQPRLSAEPGCPELGGDAGEWHWGDWDCSGVVTTRDSQTLLRVILGQGQLSAPANCPRLGVPFDAVAARV